MRVPAGDVVVSTEGNEGEAPKDSETLMILWLQAAQQGIYELGLENNTAVVAVESDKGTKLKKGLM